MIIGDYLYDKFPLSNEGELSKMRASLVNEQGFTKLALKINLGDYIFLSNAEERSEGRLKPSILSDAFEAIMGAIYIESGLERIRKVVLKLLNDSYDSITLDNLFSDYKTALQELTQAQFALIPTYKVEGSTGPDHQKEFEISIWIGDKYYAKAKGKSKKIAQQSVAKIVLEILTKDNNAE